MCVDGIGYVCESYVVLDHCDESPSLLVLSVSAYGGVVGYFLVFWLSVWVLFLVL